MDEIERRLQAWRAAHPGATLTEIQAAVEAELAAYRTQLVTEMAHEAGAEGETTPCPQCERPAMRNGVRERRLRDKDGTEVVLKRAQLRCQHCGLTFFPPG